MNNNEEKIFEKMYGKKVCSKKLNIEGFEKGIPFEIYNGYAYCADFNGHRFDMEYPQLKAIMNAEELSKAVIDYIDDINIKEEISEIHVLRAFNTLYEDGIKVEVK